MRGEKKSEVNDAGGAGGPGTAASSPCNPCAAGGTGRKKVSDAEAARLFAALLPELRSLYAKGDHPAVRQAWTEWKNFVRTPYIAETHGERYAVNLANDIAAGVYGQYRELKEMPAGGIIAKPSFMVGASGKAVPAPLYIMEKMPKGWNPATADWRYAMILPGGRTWGMTKGVNSAGMRFCHECHAGVKDNDYLFFAEEKYFIRK